MKTVLFFIAIVALANVWAAPRVDVLWSSFGSYPQGQAVFNIGNVTAIFAESVVTPAFFVTLQQEAVAWFTERFGLFGGTVIASYDPATFVTAVLDVSNPTSPVLLGEILGQVFNQNYNLVGAIAGAGLELALEFTGQESLTIVELVFYPQVVMLGKPIGGTYGAALAALGVTDVYQFGDNYAIGRYYVYGKNLLGKPVLQRTLVERSNKPARFTTYPFFLSEELQLSDPVLGNGTSQIDVTNFENDEGVLTSQIKSHWFFNPASAFP